MNVKTLFFLENKQSNYVRFAAFVAMWIIVIRLTLPWEAIPYQFEEFLFLRGPVEDLVRLVLPIFAIGVTVNLAKMLFTLNPPEVRNDPHKIPVTGFFTSAFAGIMEEVVFRWVLLYGFMGTLWFINLVLLNFASLNLEIFVTENLTWLNNLLTQGAPEIRNYPGSWTIGLAIILSNWKFQQGHVYQGIFGAIFSGIAGLFFFWVTFRHGLFAAIIVHFAFDMLVFVMLWVDVLLENAIGATSPTSKMYKWYP